MWRPQEVNGLLDSELERKWAGSLGGSGQGVGAGNCGAEGYVLVWWVIMGAGGWGRVRRCWITASGVVTESQDMPFKAEGPREEGEKGLGTTVISRMVHLSSSPGAAGLCEASPAVLEKAAGGPGKSPVCCCSQPRGQSWGFPEEAAFFYFDLLLQGWVIQVSPSLSISDTLFEMVTSCQTVNRSSLPFCFSLQHLLPFDRRYLTNLLSSLFHDGIWNSTDSVDMSLSKLQEIVKNREAWCAAVHGVTEADAP